MAQVQFPDSASCGLSLLLVLVLAPRGFSPGTPVFPSSQKPTFPNSNSISTHWRKSHLVDPLLIPFYLFIYLLFYFIHVHLIECQTELRFAFAFLRFVIGQEILRYFLDQSIVKPKPIATWSHSFCQAWQLHVFASSSDWFVELFSSVDMGQTTLGPLEIRRRGVGKQLMCSTRFIFKQFNDVSKFQ